MNILNRNFLPKNKEIRKSLLALAVYSVFVTAVINLVRDQAEQVMADTENSQNLENSPMDFLTYNPPADYGSVIERKFGPNNKKTILYVLDSHPQTMEDKESLDVQVDLYLIFKDFIDRYGSLPMVIENWPIGAKAEDFTTSHFSDETDPYAGNGLIKKIVGETDFEKRRTIVEASLGKTIVPAGMSAMFAYPELEPIGSVTPSELEYIDRSIGDLQLAQIALEYPEHFPCNKDGSLNLKKARELFEKGDLSEEILQCYCGTRGYLSYTIPAFFNDRFVQAPEREITAAINHNGNFTFVVAGTNHLPQALKIMKEKDLNYVIIAPRSLTSKVPRVLDDLPSLENLPDDSNGSCEKFQNALEDKRKEDFVE